MKMDEEKTPRGDQESLHTVTIAAEQPPPLEDGLVRVMLVKAHTWIDVVWNYNKARLGFTLLPTSHGFVDVPVEGVVQGQPLTPDQMAALLEGALRMVIPACRVFVAATQDDYGADTTDLEFE